MRPDFREYMENEPFDKDKCIEIVSAIADIIEQNNVSNLEWHVIQSMLHECYDRCGCDTDD